MRFQWNVQITLQENVLCGYSASFKFWGLIKLKKIKLGAFSGLVCEANVGLGSCVLKGNIVMYGMIMWAKMNLWYH